MGLPKMQKVLILGGNGLLGREVAATLQNDFDLSVPSHQELDMTDKNKVFESIRSLKPQCVVCAAGYTYVDGCEENPENAFRANAQGMEILACACKEEGTFLISLSTDYVFNGETNRPYREHDQPDPLSVYGESKWKGEQALERAGGKYLIVRSSWLFGNSQKGFVPFILHAIDQQKELKIIGDKIGSPTYVVDLAKAIKVIILMMRENKWDSQKYNIVHIANSGFCSWHELAQFILSTVGHNDLSLTKVNLCDFPFKAPRPKYSALDNSLYQNITGQSLRSWREALKEFLQCQIN